MATEIQHTRRSWELRIDASQMGRIYPNQGFVSLLFGSAEQAKQFMEKYPSLSSGERNYTVIQNSEYPNRLDISGPTGVVKTIDALKETIDANTSWDENIVHPYRYTYHTFN